MKMLATKQTGRLTINSVLMHCPAWTMVDLTELWFLQLVKGSDINVPGLAAGQRAYKRKMDAARHSLPMYIVGDFNKDGVSWYSSGYSSEMEGLEVNLGYLETNVLDPTIGTTIAASLELPSGTIRTAAIHVEGLKIDDRTQDAVSATLEISIPAGRFA